MASRKPRPDFVRLARDLTPYDAQAEHDANGESVWTERIHKALVTAYADGAEMAVMATLGNRWVTGVDQVTEVIVSEVLAEVVPAPPKKRSKRRGK
jgi:hypothetical protein